MTKNRALRRFTAVLGLAVSAVGLMQSPASAAPARVGRSTFQVQYSITDSAGRSCWGLATPYEHVLWASNNVSTVGGRTITCNGAKAYFLTGLTYQQGAVTAQYMLSVSELGRDCSRGVVSSGFNGPVSDNAINSNRGPLLVATAPLANGCAARAQVFFFEGRRV
jgi:hypothetical protein